MPLSPAQIYYYYSSGSQADPTGITADSTEYKIDSTLITADNG